MKASFCFGNIINFVKFVSMENLKIDRTKLITQSEYAKLKGLTRARVSQLVKEKAVKVIEIKGAKLIYLG